MFAMVCAGLSAVGFGTGQFLIQVGLRDGRVRVSHALLVNLLAANAVLLAVLAVAWWNSPPQLNLTGVVFFVGAGLMAPLFGRGSNFLAIQRVGATRTASLGMSESLFAAAIAWVVLGQELSLLSLVGMVVLITGTVLFINESARTFGLTSASAHHPDAAGSVVPASRSAAAVARRHEADRSRVWAGVAFGLFSGFLFAVAGVLRQLGLDEIPSAVLGAALGTFVALVVASVNQLRTGAAGSLAVTRKEALPLASSGIAASLGMLLFFLALRYEGTVAVSTALKNMNPLVTFALGAAFASQWERITLRLGLLVALVVFGAVLTAVGRM